MTYINNCKHDVFISYCTKNNVPDLGDDTGWVTDFVTQLKTDLEKRPKINSLDIFIDYNGLKSGEDLDAELETAVKNSAVFIAVMSHKYLESGWCTQERENYNLANKTFAGAVKSAAPTHCKRDINRLYIVEYEDIPVDGWPKEFQSIKSDKLWLRDKEGKVRTLNHKLYEKEYKNAVQDLARNVGEKLNKIKRLAEKGHWKPGDSEIESLKRKQRKTYDIPADTGGTTRRVVIEALGQDKTLVSKTLITAGQSHLVYTSFLGTYIKKSEFEEEMKTCDGFLIIHEYKTQKKIDNRVAAYDNAMAGREPGKLKKGILLTMSGDPPLPRPMPRKLNFSFDRIVIHEGEGYQLTETELQSFFQDF